MHTTTIGNRDRLPRQLPVAGSEVGTYAYLQRCLGSGRLATSPFGSYLRDKRVAAEKSLREIADALSISHVYLGEVERGRRRLLPEKYWKKLAQLIPGVSVSELRKQAVASEPIDPSAVRGRGRDVVVALARRIEENDLSDSLADELLEVLKRGKKR